MVREHDRLSLHDLYQWFELLHHQVDCVRFFAEDGPFLCASVEALEKWYTVRVTMRGVPSASVTFFLYVQRTPM
jgi:hypothetical protein